MRQRLRSPVGAAAHTPAFTWGVLTEILKVKKVWDAGSGPSKSFDITAISGTSAGALCALAIWYGLVPNTGDAECGTLDKAIERLDILWTVFAATTPIELFHNQLMSTLLGRKSKGVPFPGSNPSSAPAGLGLTSLAMMGARPEYLEFPALLNAVCPHFATIDWKQVAKVQRRVVVGAIEVLSGNFEVFDSEKTIEKMGLHPNGEKIEQYETTRWRMRRPLSFEGVAASGTLPDLLPAQKVDDTVFPTCTPGKTVTRDAFHSDSLPTPDIVMREHAQGESFDIAELADEARQAAARDLPPFWLALLPVLVVIVSNFAFVRFALPLMDTSFLAEPVFGETTIENVRGVWAVIVGLFLAILLLIAGNWRRLADLRASLDKGADASVLPIFNTASLVGFGAVIAALPVFEVISRAAMSIGGGNPLVSVASSVALLSAMTGSASGGMTIALEALGQTFVDAANATGVSLEAMHRVTAVASGALDALPHNGAVITLLAVCKLTHRESYADVLM